MSSPRSATFKRETFQSHDTMERSDDLELELRAFMERIEKKLDHMLDDTPAPRRYTGRAMAGRRESGLNSYTQGPPSPGLGPTKSRDAEPTPPGFGVESVPVNRRRWSALASKERRASVGDRPMFGSTSLEPKSENGSAEKTLDAEEREETDIPMPVAPFRRLRGLVRGSVCDEPPEPPTELPPALAPPPPPRGQRKTSNMKTLSGRLRSYGPQRGSESGFSSAGDSEADLARGGLHVPQDEEPTKTVPKRRSSPGRGRPRAGSRESRESAPNTVGMPKRVSNSLMNVKWMGDAGEDNSKDSGSSESDSSFASSELASNRGGPRQSGAAPGRKANTHNGTRRSRLTVIQAEAGTGTFRKILTRIVQRLGLTHWRPFIFLYAFLEKTISDSEQVTKTRGWKLVHNMYFNLVTSLVILVNAFFIMYTTEMTLQANIENAEVGTLDHIAGGEIFFGVFFFLELVVRMAVERFLFLIGPEFRWNLFDTSLVAFWFVDLSITSSSSNLTHARMIRLIRFFRLARITRVMRYFGNLRIVVFAILDSMSSLFGCFVVIFMMQFVFAVFFMSAASEYFSVDSSEMPRSEQAKIIDKFYGSFWKTMVTLFMVISGGIDWQACNEALGWIHPAYTPVFIFYVFVMQFGVLNVVVGAFVAAASEIAKKDRDTLVKWELQQCENLTKRIISFFQDADKDQSGTLTWDEFRTYMKDRKVKAYFQTMDLDVSQAHVLFELLDTDGGGGVELQEFLEGCMRLKGNAKSIDLNQLILLNRKLQDQLCDFMCDYDERFSNLEEVFEELCPIKSHGSHGHVSKFSPNGDRGNGLGTHGRPAIANVEGDKTGRQSQPASPQVPDNEATRASYMLPLAAVPVGPDSTAELERLWISTSSRSELV